MKAAVYNVPNNIRLEDVPEPKIKGKQVLVKFRTGSICSADLHFLRGEWKIKAGRVEEADDVCFLTTYVSPVKYPLAVDLLAKRLVDVKRMITHRFVLSDFEQALSASNNPAEKSLKTVVTA